MTAVSADDDVIDGALRLVVALAGLVIERADGVSISLNRVGRLVTVAASDTTISSMDADQYATGEGPCVDASMNGRWFHSESLQDETRWPAFVPRALGLGINAILSTPLVARDRPVGAINMYSRTAQAFDRRNQDFAATLADHVSLTLTHAGVGVSEADLAERLAEALRVREAIAQAQGILMDRETLSADEAYATLRRLSVSQDRTFAELAAEVIASARRRAPPEKGDPVPEQTRDSLDRARQDAQLSHGELFVRYFELGGMSSALQVEAFCYGAQVPSEHDHDVVAHALNERFSEFGHNHPVPYSDDPGPPSARDDATKGSGA